MTTTPTTKLNKLCRNEYVQTASVIGLIAIAVFGFWFGLQTVLNTQYPLLAVQSGSMCIPYGGACEGWTSLDHPFTRTLHTGDLILVQGVKPADLNANYPDSDIIVFHKPSNPNELIVHRIVSQEEINGTLVFRTKGDGNGNKWPGSPQLGMDSWSIPQELIVGKVVGRIPWIGHFALLMQNSIGTTLIILAIVLLVFIEFILPLLQSKKKSRDVSEPPTVESGSLL